MSDKVVDTLTLLSPEEMREMVEAMKVELQRALVEADEIDAREVEVEAERQREAKAIEERRAAYVAAARQAAPVEPSVPADTKPRGDKSTFEAWQSGEAQADKGFQRTVSVDVKADKSKFEAFKKLEAGEAEEEKPVHKTAIDVKGDKSKFEAWQTGEAQAEKPVQKAAQPDVKADKSSFEAFKKKDAGEEETFVSPRTVTVDVKADKSNFEAWQSGEAQADKGYQKTVSVNVKADKSNFEAFKNLEQGKVEEEKPVQKTAIDVKGDKSKFEAFKNLEAGKVEEPTPVRKTTVDIKGDKSKFEAWQSGEAQADKGYQKTVAVNVKADKSNFEAFKNLEQGKVEEEKPVQKTAIDVKGDKSKFEAFKNLEQGKTEEEKPVFKTAVDVKGDKSKFEAFKQLEQQQEEKPAPAPAPRKTSTEKKSVAGRWNPDAPKEEEKKAELKPAETRRGSSVKGRWDPNHPASEEEHKPAASAAPAAGGSIKARWNPDAQKEEEKKPAPAAAPKTGGSVANRWSGASNDAAAATSSRASELEEIRKMKEKEKNADPSGGEGGAMPTFKESAEELDILVNVINHAIKGDKDLNGFQLETGSAPGAALADGTALLKAFDKLLPGVVDVRAMTRNPKDNRDKVDNWNLILGSAKMAGCRVVRITSEACAQGNETQIQTVLWEIIRVAQETRVKKLKVYLENVFPKEKITDLVKWPIEKLLTAWINAHTATIKQPVKVAALPNDLKDGLAYATVLAGLTKSTEAFASMSGEDRMNHVVMMAAAQGLDASASGLLAGTWWEHYLFLSQLLIKVAETPVV